MVRLTNNESVTFTCRMRKDLCASILSESEKKGVSFNSLINNIIRKYDSWDRLYSDIGFVTFSNIAISKIFDILDEKDIRNIARYVGEIIPKEMAILSHVEDDFEKISQLVYAISEKFGNTTVAKRNSDYTYTIRHKVNLNFSVYVSEFFKGMAKSFNVKVTILIAEKNIVIFSLEHKKLEIEKYPKKISR